MEVLMQIIDNIIILSLIVLAFLSGKKISDIYNNKIIEELKAQCKKYEIEKGIGYVAREVPQKRIHIGQDFMDRLKENGHATQTLR
ncbi:MAG: hypothetical protein J6W49_04690 [Paludibacteraceae bacterium]|nr:hypothetical protein [Paludibacteraceae bacterium]